MSPNSGTAIIGAAAAARAHGSGGKTGLRALWSDKKTVYIAIFASLVSTSLSHGLLDPRGLDLPDMLACPI